MTPGGERVMCEVVVIVVGGRDHDRVDVIPVEHLAMIGKPGNSALRGDFVHGLLPACTYRGDGRQRMFVVNPYNRPPHLAQTDDRDTHPFHGSPCVSVPRHDADGVSSIRSRRRKLPPAIAARAALSIRAVANTANDEAGVKNGSLLPNRMRFDPNLSTKLSS